MKRNWMLALLVLGFLIYFGLSFPIYYVNLAAQVLVAVLRASSLNLQVGVGGLDSFCHAAISGICSYAVIYVYSTLGLGHGVAIGAALVIGIGVSALFGLIALRAKGLSFLMITVALGLVAWGLAYRWVDVTGGDHGLGGLVRPRIGGVDFADPQAFYLLVLAIVTGSVLLIRRVMLSPMGAILRGAKDQERRMSALGYDVWRVRWVAFTVSGAFACVGGILFAYYHKFISPESLSIISSAEIYLMVLVGGVGTLIGPVIGAILVTMTQLWVSSYVERWVMLLGMMYILVVLLMPQGIAPALQRLAGGRAVPARSPVADAAGTGGSE